MIFLGKGFVACIVLAISTGTLGCNGQISSSSAGSEPQGDGPGSRGSGGPSGASDGGDTLEPVPSLPPGGAAQPGAEEDFFQLRVASTDLLPFRVRMDRVRRLFDLSLDSEALSDMRAGRLGLGDHDYGAGHLPSHLWTASIMSRWVEALRPICQQAFSQNVADSPEAAGAFLERAYGRRVSLEEANALLDEVRILPESERSELICLAALSSVEFVAR